MSAASLLLRAYYERLHERMESRRGDLLACVDVVLAAELRGGQFGSVDEDRRAAYREAAVAFIDERLESYNPVGIQYTFERARSREAYELQVQLDWYDSRAEFEALKEAARSKAEGEMTDERLLELADELIREVGAFPDASIISGYEAKPALSKLPDYVAARAIEELVK